MSNSMVAIEFKKTVKTPFFLIGGGAIFNLIPLFMSILSVLIPICLLLLILLGAFLFIYAIFGFSKRNSQSRIKLPFIKTEIQGPAWMVCIVIGAILVGSPILLAAFQKPSNVTIPPPPTSVQQVLDIPEPGYKSFRFIRDISLLDLRAVEVAPWYTQIPGWNLIYKRPRMKPAILKNYMVIRKVDTATYIHIVYSTSGKLDVRCPTHRSFLRHAEEISDTSKPVDVWEVIADVSAVPVGEEFELTVEATYWNGFSGKDGDDYTTYGHAQTEAEQISIIAFFPEDKPFKNIGVTEIPPDGSTGGGVQGQGRTWAGASNQTYYWTVVSTRPRWFYKLAWTW